MRHGLVLIGLGLGLSGLGLGLACSDQAFTEKVRASELDNDKANPAHSNSDAVDEANSAGNRPGTLPDKNGDGRPDLASATEVAKLQAACKKEEVDKILATTQTLVYPERKNCSWDSPPNLGRRDAFHQAREISAGQLQLPPGVICEMTIQSKPGSLLHYDDFLVLTLAQQLIFGSNRELVARLETQGGLYIWDFARIAGKSIGNFEAPIYCLGQGDRCRLPAHDQKGPVQIALGPQEIGPITLMLAQLEAKQVAMDLVATGDNDDEDCFHSALDLDVTFKYLPR